MNIADFTFWNIV